MALTHIKGDKRLGMTVYEYGTENKQKLPVYMAVPWMGELRPISYRGWLRDYWQSGVAAASYEGKGETFHGRI